MATASPAKFPEAVEKALCMEQDSSDLKKGNCASKEVSNLFHLPVKYNDKMNFGANWTTILREKIEEISDNICKDGSM